MLTATRRHGRPSRALCAPAAATAAATSRAVTPGPDRATSVTASASRAGRSRDGATRSAGRASLPTSPGTSGTRPSAVRGRNPAPRSTPGSPSTRGPDVAPRSTPGSDVTPRSTPGPRGSGPRRGSVAEGGSGCSRLSTPSGEAECSRLSTPLGWSRAARRVTTLWPSKAAWWQATATRVPPDPATTRTGGWVVRSKWATSSGAWRGSPSTVSSSGGGPGRQVSWSRRAPVIGTAWCNAASRSWNRATGAARVAAATTAQVVRRSGKRSKASALAEAGAGRSWRRPIARPPRRRAGPARVGDPRTGRSANIPRLAARARPAGGTTAAGSSRPRTRGDAAHRRTGGSG